MVRFPSPLGPDETPERAAYWIAQAHPQARRKLYEAYVACFTEEDPAFDVDAFAARVHDQLDLRRKNGELMPP